VSTVVVFFEAPSDVRWDVGLLLLNLAAVAWESDRLSTFLVDADPRGRLTREAEKNLHKFLPRVGEETTLEDLFSAAADLDVSPRCLSRRLTRKARSLVRPGRDVMGAHARALGAVVASGGALDLGGRTSEWLRGSDAGLVLVSAPLSSTGLGALLGSLADEVVVLCGGDASSATVAFDAVDRLSRAADPRGPSGVIPVFPTSTPFHEREPSIGGVRRASPVCLSGTDTPERVGPLFRSILSHRTT